MRQSGRMACATVLRLIMAAAAVALYAVGLPARAQTQALVPTQSLVKPPLVKPRFASLKTDRVVVRQAPATDAPVLWTFHRLGWPVEVLRESGAFAEVRDSDGAVGWVSTLLLSGRRTAIVVGTPAQASPVVLRADGRETARPAAELELGLQAVVVGCDGRWCRLLIGDVKGWLEQTRLWGVYAGERIE
jgi:SH3-like domain-containing protein